MRFPGLRVGVLLLLGLGCALTTPVEAKPRRSAAIRLDAPGRLDKPGAYYLLTKDVSAPTHGFVIAAKDVTLDLGGHTLTYGTGGLPSFGVASRHQYHQGTITVMNGRIVQGGGPAKGCHAVDFAGGHDLVFEDLELDVRGTDACGIEIDATPTGKVVIRHCTVHCRTTRVTNRHYPGVAAIRLEDVPGEVEIAHNRITASPQWGIQVAAKNAKTTCRIHHNVVQGTKALVANGYMLGIHRRGVDAYLNQLEGESRGIHVDGVDHDGHHAKIRFNRIVAQDQPNPEYPKHWCHGIKLENTAHTVVSHNDVRVVADATHSEARALDLDVESGGPVTIFGNRFAGISKVPGKLGKALVWTGLQRGNPASIDIQENVFLATDVLIHRTWHSDKGVRIGANSWLRDPDAPRGRPLYFERWDNQDGKPSKGHMILDAHAPEGTTKTMQWEKPGPYESQRWRSIRFRILEEGKVRQKADIRIEGADPAFVAQKALNQMPSIEIPVLVSRITTGGRLTYLGPFRIVIGFGGRNHVLEKVDLRGPRAFTFETTTGALLPDLDPPAAPTGLKQTPKRRDDPDRALAADPGEVPAWALTWDRTRDAGGLFHTQIEVDGVPFQRVRGWNQGLVLAGLRAGGTYQIRLRAVDYAGNVGPASPPLTVKIPKVEAGRRTRR